MSSTGYCWLTWAGGGDSLRDSYSAYAPGYEENASRDPEWGREAIGLFADI